VASEHNVNALSQLHVSQYWFSDYWFSSGFPGLGIPWAFISMFMVQLLTLAAGLVSARFCRRNLLLFPFLLSSAVAVLMTYEGEKISGDAPAGALSGGYRVGYYLVFPSLAMFLFAFLLDEGTKNREREQKKKHQDCRTVACLGSEPFGAKFHPNPRGCVCPLPPCQSLTFTHTR